jgi:hypothetical protein
MSTVFEWVLERIYGTPIPNSDAKQLRGQITAADGYGPGQGSQAINFTDTASEYDLAKNAVYRCLSTHDGYLGVISLADETIDGYGEDPVTDATGMKFLADQVFFLTTQKGRHLLSVKAPDATNGDGLLRELRVVKMDARSGR